MKIWEGGICTLIMENFSATEVEEICSLPICPTGLADKLIWPSTSNGNLSRKSAYHMGKNLIVQSSVECSRASTISKLWTTMWALNVPSVVKVFLWKACNNLLPTKENLFKKKKMTSVLLRPICAVDAETICHIL